MLEICFAFIGTIAFSGLFNIPRREYMYCGIAGGLGWICYSSVAGAGQSVAMASFYATLVLTLVSRYLAVYRRMPLTIFLIPGIFPLVPGAGLYYTAYHIFMNENALAVSKGMETAKIAVAITLGIVFISSLPQSFFTNIARYHRKI